MTRHPPKLSVVVPCYNEQEVLPETANRLSKIFDGLIEEGRIHSESRIYFVDDGSTDRTWAIVEDLNRNTTRFEGVKLSRNRGHQNALLAGLFHAPGDAILSIDADLQDDFNAINGMLKAHSDGADIVFGVRNDRSSDTHFKRASAQIYYRLLKGMGVEVIYNHADYRLMSRRAVEALRQYPESNLFLRAMIPELGFRTAIVCYERYERFAGVSKYPLQKMIALAVQGVTSFSVQPLRIITLFGFIISIASFLLSAWALIAAVVFHSTIPGWASTVIPIYLICGVQMLCLGVIGEYIGKIYIETKHRPRFLVDTTTEQKTRLRDAP